MPQAPSADWLEPLNLEVGMECEDCALMPGDRAVVRLHGEPSVEGVVEQAYPDLVVVAVPASAHPGVAWVICAPRFARKAQCHQAVTPDPVTNGGTYQ